MGVSLSVLSCDDFLSTALVVGVCFGGCLDFIRGTMPPGDVWYRRVYASVNELEDMIMCGGIISAEVLIQRSNMEIIRSLNIFYGYTGYIDCKYCDCIESVYIIYMKCAQLVEDAKLS